MEITPDRLPSQGDTVDVRNYDTDTSQTCLVETVTRNARTVEVVVRTHPRGSSAPWSWKAVRETLINGLFALCLRPAHSVRRLNMF